MQRPEYDPYSSLNQKLIDGAIAAISLYLAYLLRFEGQIPPDARWQLWYMLPVILLGQISFNMLLGTYRMIWRYVSLADAVILARNFAAFWILLLLLRWSALPAFRSIRVPFSVVALSYLLSLVGGFAARALRRLHYEGLAHRALRGASAKPVLLIGAGRAGMVVAKELGSRMDIRPVGFLDDDPKKRDSTMCGLRVLGPLSALALVIQEHCIREVIVCFAKPPRQVLKRIWATCEQFSVPVKSVPALEEILEQKVNIANFRNVEMSDLLPRDPVELTTTRTELMSIYADRCILVTGAGGSIGGELAWQLATLNPKRLVLLDKDENGLNDTCLRLRAVLGSRMSVVVADLRFAERLHGIFETFHPEIVFHAAAHKHVHLMEENPCEAISNNVVGSHNLVAQAVNSGVSRFVQISTDKAVNPKSVMGASKRVCERIVQAYRGRGGTRFCCVRFGNVLGSRGSVIPIFQRQILAGGPVTVTHPDAQRFLMTIPEAVCLLIEAGSLAENGEMFVLDMGEPVLIRNLAHDLIELSGLRPNRDVEIQITGMQPGEKLTELLSDDITETVVSTRFEKIRRITGETFDTAEFLSKLRALERAAATGRTDDVYAALHGFQIGFQGGPEATPWIGDTEKREQARGVGA